MQDLEWVIEYERYKESFVRVGEPVPLDTVENIGGQK